jgi:hypothetical protein
MKNNSIKEKNNFEGIRNFLRHPLLHIVIIIGGGISFSMLPRLVTKMPLHALLSSDAEVYATFMQIVQNPEVFARDDMLRQFELAPAGMRFLFQFLIKMAEILNVEILQWSIWVSFLSLILFLLGLYWLLYYWLENKLYAFVITFFSIIPVHVLGGTTYGFQALGFLPRDLALAVHIFVLLVYFQGLKRDSNVLIGISFLAMGILANAYPLLFFQLFAMLLFSELIRTRVLSKSLFVYAGLFLAGSAPAWIEIIFALPTAAPIDSELLRLRLGYMMAYPLDYAIFRYLRRVILYFGLMVLLYWPLSRWASNSDRRIIKPWKAIIVSSFVISVFGIVIETFTPYAKYSFSRASIWFTLSAMVIACIGLRIVFYKFFPRHSLWLTVVTISIIFAGQSNLPSIYRYLRDGYETREQRLAFHAAVGELKTLSGQDSLIVAPSTEMNDIAASLRTYSLRSVYVSYKDGGVAVNDGELARKWYNRYKEAQSMFDSRDSGYLLDLMVREDIDFAFVPANYYADSDPILDGRLVYQGEQYIIIQRDP